MKDTKDMWIASNVDKVGDFDDVVLYRKNSSDQSVAYLFQLKHQENPKKITPHEFTYSAKSTEGKRKKWKVDFSLPKYNDGFLELKRNLEDGQNDHFEVLKQIKAAHKLVLIIYTNKDVSSECKFLNEVNDQTLDFINTGTNKQKLYKFDPGKLNYDSEFLNKLLLFANQSHVNDCQKLIKKEIKNLMSSCSATIDFKKVTKKFVEFIKKWIKGDGVDESKDNVRIYTSLTKADILAKLTFIILEPFVFVLFEDPFTQYSCPTKQKWNTILSSKSITVVNFDEETLPFLKEYLGSELSKYSNNPSKTWNEELSKQSQNVFLQHHQDLKLKLLKLICDCKNLTMLDIYISLWFDKQLPLLLKIEDNNTMKTIEKMHKLCNLTFLVLSTETATFPTITNIFTTLNDLNQEEKAEILNQNVCVQGRPRIPLENITNPSMYQHIKTIDIIKIFLGAYNIGYNYEPLPPQYMPQSLSKVFFDITSLSAIKQDLIVIDDIDQGTFDALAKSAVPYPREKPRSNLLFFNEAPKAFPQNKTIHHFKYSKDFYFEWTKSSGSLQNIQQHQLIESNKFSLKLKSDDDYQLPHRIDLFWTDLTEVCNDLSQPRLISANPGMGKSVLLNYVAQNAPPDKWILKVDLKEHYDYYETESSNTTKEHLKYFSKKLVDKYKETNAELSNAVYQRMLDENNIVVLLDGFDEISISYKEQVADIIKRLHKSGIALCVTTRPVMKKYLEKQLNLISTTLKPFASKTLNEFLTLHFAENHKNADPAIIKSFSQRLLKAAYQNLLDSHFMGVPLQIKLLADVFDRDLQESLKTNVVDFKDNFDLLFLYREFINQKNKIVCEKFGIGAKEMRVFFEKHQQLFALKYLFAEDELEVFNVDNQLVEYYENEESKLQFLQRDGVLIVEDEVGGKIEFVHYTFAEYLAALWFTKNYRNKKEELNEAVRDLLKERLNPFLATIFDSILAQGHPLHLAIINKRYDRIRELLKDDLSLLNEEDKGGRTPLHLIALYGVAFQDSDASEPSNFVGDEYVRLLDEIPDEKIVNSSDNVFMYNPLDYALTANTLAVANRLCEKYSDWTLQINTYDKEELFTYCAVFRFKALFTEMLYYFAFKELLTGEVGTETTIKDYCALTNEDHSNALYEFIEELNETLLVNLVKNFNNLHIASAFGTTEKIMELLASGREVDEEDIQYNTALHYATIHKRPDSIKLLVSKGADVNYPGNIGNTALHCAAQNDDVETIKLLIDLNADMDQANNDDDTPLNLALLAENVECAKFLVDQGANPVVANDDKQVALHLAAEFQYLEVVDSILRQYKNASKSGINLKEHCGLTPLHLVIIGPPPRSCYTENILSIVKLLLNNGALVNEQSNLGNTPLHSVSKVDNASLVDENEEVDLPKFYKSLIQLLLEKGAKPELKNLKGNTVLEEAVDNNNSTMISILQEIT